MTDKNIPVLDSQHKFLSYTSSAKSRILIKDGRASIFSKNPFMIKLKGEIGDSNMAIKKQSTGNLITNFTKYFSEPREVYVQNMSSTQIAITFPGFGGPAGDIHLLIPRTKKPYNLTQDVPFDSIARSTDFRKMVNRRNPPLLRLLDEEEFIAYFERAAQRNDTSFEEEMQVALDIKDNISNRVPVAESIMRTNEQAFEDKREELEKPPEIHPQIVGLCASADKDWGSERIKATDFIENLETLAPDLSVDDLEFVMTKGVYKTVKKYASDLFDEMTNSEEDDE